MIERFFRYSMEHARPIRLLIDTAEKKLSYITCIIVCYDESSVTFLKRTKTTAEKAVSLPLQSVLSADYARGDHGDTMQFIKKEEQNEQTD